MRTVHRALVAAAVLGLAAIGLVPAAQAGPVTVAAIPADCTLTGTGDHIRTITCTDRPATQTWRLTITCYPFGRMVTRFGNLVTGDGASTASCGVDALEAFNPQFVVVS
ncbi:MAG TPA: hypothetical protein VGD67_05815 [Pseudonocardiaceae bacterium]